MPARSTRQEARDRIFKAFRAPLDRLIPADEQVPLKGPLFVDFEDQAEALIRAASPVFLEERAVLGRETPEAAGFAEPLEDYLRLHKRSRTPLPQVLEKSLDRIRISW